ncbi:HEAT repeat domain-containing protein [Methanolacinia paynteri]|uniref:HEAT repeat domain-containing protein n=1 Tax=Methanolacinia paynteri TaxID=230356 RepID=UPI00064F55EB|nr:HEAT repeat domain-containing protein [Methanolacinia paynteri]
MALFDRKDREEDESAKETEIERSIRALGSKDWEKRQEAAIRLSGAGKPAIVHLLKALNDDNALIRTGAAEILGTYGEPAIPTLMKLLVTGKERVRDGAARAIGQNGEKAINPLKEALESDNYKSRRGAALALGYLDYLGNEITQLLVQALLDKNQEVSRQAALSLSNMKWVPANNRQAALFFYGLEDYEKLSKTGKDGVIVLSADLKNPDPKARKKVAQTLKKINSDDAAKPLTVLANDSDAGVRHAAIEAIGEIKDPRLLPYLVKALDDEDPSVRVEASWSLEKSGWKPANNNEKARFLMVKERWADLVQMRENAVPTLVTGLCNQNPAIRIKCTEVLRAMGSIGYAAINDAMKSSDPVLKKAAIEAASRIKEKDSLSAEKKKTPHKEEKESKDESLEEQLKRQKASMAPKDTKAEEGWMRKLQACGIEGERKIKLAKALSDKNEVVRSAAIENLKQSGIITTDCLLYLLLDKKDNVRVAAIESLGDLKSTKAAPYIAKTLADKNLNVRMASAHSLGLIQEPKSIPSLIRCFSDPNRELRKEAASAVSKMGNSSLPYIKKSLESSDLDARITALESLGKIADPLAISLAVRMLNDSEYDVRSTAVVTLRNMSDQMFNALMDEARRLRVQGNVIEKNGIIVVLAGIEDLRAREVLAEFTADSNENVRNKALELLGGEAVTATVKTPAGTAPGKAGDDINKLISELKSGDVMVQMGAVEKISMLGDKAIKPLINSIDDKNPEFQNLVAEILTGMGDPAVKSMIRELKAGRPSVKIILAQNLAKIPEKRTITALCEVLYEEKDPVVRMVAAESLGFIGDQQGLEALIYTVNNDEDSRVKNAAIISLGYFKDPKAINTLITVLDSKDHFMCKKASDSLKNSGNEAIPYLLDAMSSGTHNRSHIAHALEALSWVPETERDIIFYLAARDNWDEIERIGEQAIEVLAELQNDKDPEFRASALEMIERIGGDASVQPLILALGDNSAPIRIRAENALLERGKTVVPYLEQAVADTEDPNIRTFAMKLLKKLES